MSVISYEDKVNEKYANQPHEVCELICIQCGHRYVGMYPESTLLKNLECPVCSKVGWIIKTGQTIDSSMIDDGK